MAKPRVFISSTFYDLKQIRSELDNFIDSFGYEAVRNEEGDIPYGKQEELEEYCYQEIKQTDIFISIIGGRFGSQSKRGSSSISQMELKTAIKENKQVYIFIENNILTEYETFSLNKGNKVPIKVKYVDDIKIYHFIEEVKALDSNNNIKSFNTTFEITKYLKEQFAGLFKKFLEEQTRLKEVSIINKLEKTTANLNKLVTFLSEEHKDKSEEVNKILSINHPLTESLRESLSIEFNFYIEGSKDLDVLLFNLGFSKEESGDFDDYFIYHRYDDDFSDTLKVSVSLFDNDNRLIYIKKTDWQDIFFYFNREMKFADDDLPF